MDNIFASAALIVQAAATAARNYDFSSRTGRIPLARQRRSVSEIYNCLGSVYFRRAYRMSFESFWRLHLLLLPHIETCLRQFSNYEKKGGRFGGNYVLPPIRNGEISTSVRLACAIRYFAGGSAYDIAVMFGTSYSVVLSCVWIVVSAVNMCPALYISYPDSVEEQRKIAAEFEKASTPGINNCAGAIDGILIWILKPSMKESKNAGVGQKKFFYCLAFEASDLHRRLENGLMKKDGEKDRFVLFGDNAYLNTSYMATPLPNVAGNEDMKSKDNYNFYHSQLRIRVECAFGMLVQKWGILRMAMPRNLSIKKIIAMVNALAKLHNFCIDEHDIPERALAGDMNNIVNHDQGYVEMSSCGDESYDVPMDLMDAGHHFNDVPRFIRRQNSIEDGLLPRMVIHDFIANGHWERLVFTN
eukprot:CCRYP_013780-RA/>CCRYP_013780-RA protein AED:0.21 eAED:0.16 QI:0/0/0/1/1/1/2/0/414